MKPRFLVVLLVLNAAGAMERQVFGQPGDLSRYNRGPAAVVAVNRPAQDPDALVAARQAYDAKVKAATDPLKAGYARQLEELMNSYSAKGDVAAANAVKIELAKLSDRVAPATIVGKWTWDGLAREFRDNGVFIGAKGKVQGTWKMVDPKERKYVVIWLDDKGRPNGYVDKMQLSGDGSTLAGTNNEGHPILGNRAKRPAANGSVTNHGVAMPKLKSAAPSTTIVGKWAWDGWGGGARQFLESGVFIGGRGKIQGTWKIVDAKERKYEVVGMDEKGHLTGWTDSLQVSADGSTLSGKNSRGLAIHGKRVVEGSGSVDDDDDPDR